MQYPCETAKTPDSLSTKSPVVPRASSLLTILLALTVNLGGNDASLPPERIETTGEDIVDIL